MATLAQKLLLKQNFINPFWLITLSLVLFLPSVFTFFAADDWYHLRISAVSDLNQFINFFSFLKTDQSASFYRPLSTQVFFFLNQSFFGLNAFYYHLIVMVFFATSLILLFNLTLKLSQNKSFSLLVLFMYSISATHFTRLYFLSAFQEILMFTLLLLSFSFYLPHKLKSYTLSIITFLFALLSKETAIIFPFILIIYHLVWGGPLTLSRVWNPLFLKNNKKVLLKISPFVAILLVYLFLRFFLFGGIEGDSYTWDFSLKKLLNTYFWYFLWSLGTPEFLVDYVSGGFRVLPRFFDVLPVWSTVILALLFFSFFSLGFLVVNTKKVSKIIILGLGIFVFGLLPVAFLPWHKFTLELTLPLWGFCLFVASFLYYTDKKWLGLIFILVFIIFNLITNYLSFKTNYIVSRAEISKKVYNFFSSNHPFYPSESIFYFINDKKNLDPIWGLSKQIAFATSKSELFKVIYKNPKINVYFEDLDSNIPRDKNIIRVPSNQFLK